MCFVFTIQHRRAMGEKNEEEQALKKLGCGQVGKQERRMR